MSVVAELLRHPLKSAQAEDLQQAEVQAGGLRGDRRWACVDAGDGTLGSAKHPQRWGALLQVGVRTEERAGEHACVLDVAGREVLAGTRTADEALSGVLGRDVRLTRVVPERPRLHRRLPDEAGLVPDWLAGVDPGQEMVTPVAGARPQGDRFLDFGALHLVTTGALTALAGHLGRAGVDARPFRPNLVLDAPGDPSPGQVLRLGELVLRVLLPTSRCVVPGLGPDGRVDRELLAALGRHHRVQVGDHGRAACFGVYAEVLRPGRVEVGQRVDEVDGWPGR